MRQGKPRDESLDTGDAAFEGVGPHQVTDTHCMDEDMRIPPRSFLSHTFHAGFRVSMSLPV
jgi:hypothetical protein